MGLLQKIVRNDAMRQDPAEIYQWRIYVVACSSCFGGMVFGWDTGTIGGVLTLPAFKAKYGLSDLNSVGAANLAANIVSTLQIGAFAGALIATWFADKYGRRPALLITSVIITIGVILQGGSDGRLAVMYIGRFIAGVGCGFATMINPLFIAECSPRAIRGGLTGLYQLFNTIGVMLSFWVNYGSDLHLSGAASYAIPLTLQAIPSIALFIGMYLCMESPRWLAKQDRWEEAEANLSKVRHLPASHPYIQVAGGTFKDLMKEMWLIPGNRKRAIISIALMILQNLTGVNAINYYAPQIFKNLGITGNSTGLFATGIYGIVKMVSCASFLLFFADSLGRRRSLLWTSIALGCAMFYIGLYVRIAPPAPGAPVIPAGYVALVCIYLYAAFFQFGWGAVCWILVSEIPAARLRALNVSFAASTQWLFQFVIARATPNMLVTMGSHGYGTYLFFGSCCFFMFPFTWFFIPETKGLSLEAMDELFGVTELVDKKIELERERREATDVRTGSGERQAGDDAKMDETRVDTVQEVV